MDKLEFENLAQSCFSLPLEFTPYQLTHCQAGHTVLWLLGGSDCRIHVIALDEAKAMYHEVCNKVLSYLFTLPTNRCRWTRPPCCPSSVPLCPPSRCGRTRRWWARGGWPPPAASAGRSSSQIQKLARAWLQGFRCCKYTLFYCFLLIICIFALGRV